MPPDVYRGPGAPLTKSDLLVCEIDSLQNDSKLEYEFNKWFKDNQLVEILSIVELSNRDTVFTVGRDAGEHAWSVMVTYKILSMDLGPDVCLRAKVLSLKTTEDLMDRVRFFLDEENPINILHQLRLSGSNFSLLMIYSKRR